jgi:hypothetical protein
MAGHQLKRPCNYEQFSLLIGGTGMEGLCLDGLG